MGAEAKDTKVTPKLSITGWSQVSYVLDPCQVADLFWQMDSEEQAGFFNQLGQISSGKLGTQIFEVVDGGDLDVSGKVALSTIADYVATDEERDLLKKQNLELKAQVEQIKQAVQFVRDSSYTKGFGYPDAAQVKAQREAWQKLNEAIEASVAQCLAEVKAQAVESILKTRIENAFDSSGNIRCFAIRLYAEQIRFGEVKI